MALMNRQASGARAKGWTWPLSQIGVSRAPQSQKLLSISLFFLHLTSPPPSSSAHKLALDLDLLSKMSLFCLGRPTLNPLTLKAKQIPIVNPVSSQHGRVLFISYMSFMLSFMAWVRF
jgi:hypothetical protein